MLKATEMTYGLSRMENGVSRYGGGIVQLMMQWKKKGDFRRSGKVVAAMKTMF